MENKQNPSILGTDTWGQLSPAMLSYLLWLFPLKLWVKTNSYASLCSFCHICGLRNHNTKKSNKYRKEPKFLDFKTV